MAADPQTEKQVTRNLKTEPPARNINPAFSKEGSPSDATSCISYTGEAAGGIKEAEVDHDSLTTPYQDNSYHGYYYPGNDVSFAEVDEQGHYSSSNGLGIQYPAMQADNGSLIYYTPGFQPCYDYYSSYFPVAPLGIDGQYVGQQPYSPGSMFSSPIASPGYISTPPPYGSDLVQSSYVWDPSFLVGNGGYVNSYSGYPDNAVPVSTSSAASHVPAPAPRFMLTSDFSKPSALVVSTGHGAREAVDKPSHQCPTLLPSHQQSKSGLLYSNSSQNLKASAKSWEGSGKLHTRNRSNGVGDFSLLNMHNHGPRTVNAKDALGNEAGSFSIEGNGSDNNIVSKTRRDQYNRPDFPTNYNHGLFFVIKSYSEDDIHKSIKYNVWASTSNGNKRLDSAYQEAQERMKEQGSKCPLFLFFSVNASGQFCGVAEMVGRVDFNKNMDFWQQDKWTGYFPVKWHIIKDVPNPQLRHIILENNDNKPVTNSRDTQEVRFSQGIEMLNIFVNFVFKTCILDDFEFYERRQKVMQEKRMKPCPPRSDSFQPKSEDMAIRFHSLDISGEPEKGDEGKE